MTPVGIRWPARTTFPPTGCGHVLVHASYVAGTRVDPTIIQMRCSSLPRQRRSNNCALHSVTSCAPAVQCILNRARHGERTTEARAARGLITIGTLTFLASSFAGSRNYIQSLLQALRDIDDQTLYLRDLFLYFEIQPTITVRQHGDRPSVNPTWVRVRERGFRYHGSNR
jgi:hypothetical protein